MEAVSRGIVHQGHKLFIVKNICSFLCITYLGKFEYLAPSPSQNFLCKQTGFHTIQVLALFVFFTLCPELTQAQTFPTHTLQFTSGHSRSILPVTCDSLYSLRYSSSVGYNENRISILICQKVNNPKAHALQDLIKHV